jgi:tripartite-type tricarboxylate transporter receptor subunit TctC
VAPAGLPAEPLERLRAAFKGVLEDPEVVAALNKAGCEEVGRVPVGQLTEMMRSDLAKWGEVIRAANITLDN